MFNFLERFYQNQKVLHVLVLFSLFPKPAIYAHYELYIIVELLAVNYFVSHEVCSDITGTHNEC